MCISIGFVLHPCGLVVVFPVFVFSLTNLFWWYWSDHSVNLLSRWALAWSFISRILEGSVLSEIVECLLMWLALLCKAFVATPLLSSASIDADIDIFVLQAHLPSRSFRGYQLPLYLRFFFSPDTTATVVSMSWLRSVRSRCSFLQILARTELAAWRILLSYLLSVHVNRVKFEKLELDSPGHMLNWVDGLL